MAWSRSGLFQQTQRDQWLGTLTIDLSAEDGKFAFWTSNVTPNFATDTAYGTAPWNSGESSGAGYIAGGVPLLNTTLTLSNNTLVFDADNIELQNSTITAEGGIIYWPNKGNRLLLAVWFGEPKETQDGTFLITWATSGIAVMNLA